MTRPLTAAVFALAAVTGATAQPTPTTKEATTMIRTKLEELDRFKGDPEFHRIGFGTAGKYHPWLASIEAARKSDEAKSYTLEQKIALSDLLSLGLTYARQKGEESKYTRYAREEIMKVVNKK